MSRVTCGTHHEVGEFAGEHPSLRIGEISPWGLSAREAAATVSPVVSPVTCSSSTAEPREGGATQRSAARLRGSSVKAP